MGKILSFIEGYMSGNAWEELCVECYRMRYQDSHYRDIPAVHRGDAGIEGFALNGVVHQCYCPEREYSDDDLYEHQRNKLTADIKKLMKNANRLKKLGVPPIREWHFNMPEYRDDRIVSHIAYKQQEVLTAKAENPSEFEHIADGFQIIPKIAEDFKPEISRIIRTTVTDMRLNFAIQHTVAPNWEQCDSQKVENITRKIKAVMHVEDETNEDLNDVINIYVEFYISGLEIMSRLRTSFPEIYEDIFQLERSYKKEVSIKTKMNTNRSMNKDIFESILADFESKLRQDFSKMLTSASIGELKQDLIASWLADCSMEFRSA
jgi:hypothetical protein